MNNHAVRGAIREFDAANGGPQNCIVDGNWVIFANGASRENTFYGVMIDPPTDPPVLAQRVLRYHKVALDRAIEEFERLKTRLRQQAAEAVRFAGANAPPPPPSEEELDELRSHQLKVQKARRAYNAARTEHAPRKTQEELDAIEARRTSGERTKALIDDIKI